MNTEKIVFEVMSANLSLNQALKIVLKNKNWKQIIRDVLSKNKTSGIRDSLLVAAILALSNILGTVSADELITKIENVVERKVPDDVLVNKLETILPYPVSKFELSALNKRLPISNNPLVSLKSFNDVLRKKIEDSMEKIIIPNIQKDDSLKYLEKDTLSDLLTKAFKKKLEKPENSEAFKILKKYLEDQNQNENYTYKIVEKAVQESL